MTPQTAPGSANGSIRWTLPQRAAPDIWAEPARTDCPSQRSAIQTGPTIVSALFIRLPPTVLLFSASMGPKWLAGVRLTSALAARWTDSARRRITGG